MINPFTEVNWKPDRQAKRQFARSLVIGFPVMALVWMLVGKLSSGSWSVVPAVWLGGIGMAVGIVLWLFPGIAKPFYIIWYGVACSIGLVISNLLFVTFYFTVVTAFGMMRRAMGRQALQKQPNRGNPTYWKDAEQISDPKRYYSQF